MATYDQIPREGETFADNGDVNFTDGEIRITWHKAFGGFNCMLDDGALTDMDVSLWTDHDEKVRYYIARDRNIVFARSYSERTCQRSCIDRYLKHKAEQEYWSQIDGEKLAGIVMERIKQLDAEGKTRP